MPEQHPHNDTADTGPAQTAASRDTPSTGGMVRVLAGAVCISFSAVFVRVADADPDVAAFYRTLFGALVLGAYAAARSRSFRAPARHYGLLLVCGVLLALDLTLWHRCIPYVGPGLATILGNFQVFVVAGVGALVFGERLGLRYFASVIMALAGLWLLLGVDPGDLPPGALPGLGWGLATAVFYGLFILMLRYTQRNAGDEVNGRKTMSASANMVVISLMCAALVGLVALGQGHSFILPTTTGWLAMAGYGMGSQALGWVLISTGLPKVPAAAGALAMLLQPALAFVWDILLFQRPTGPVGAVGAAMALLAIYLGLKSAQRVKP